MHLLAAGERLQEPDFGILRVSALWQMEELRTVQGAGGRGGVGEEGWGLSADAQALLLRLGPWVS